jgi:protein subunit release factor B
VSERDLILSVRKSDFIITPFRSSGPGGQHRNKTATAIRIYHPSSGATAECTEHKSQHQNKKVAWERIRETPKFQLWLKKAIAEASLTADQRKALEKSIMRAVERQMDAEMILVEVQDENGKWVPMPQLSDE